HRRVNLQPPGCVHDDGAAACLLGIAHRLLDKLDDIPGPGTRIPGSENRNTDLLAQLLELLRRRRSIHVRRDEARSLLLEIQTTGELRRSRGLSRDLQALELVTTEAQRIGIL